METSKRAGEVLAGQAVYNRFTLNIYDMYVLHISCRFIWRCPKQHMLDNYQRNIGARHLEMGVGTAYLPNAVAYPAPPAITLLDLNPTTLTFGARRLARYAPTTICADVLQPLPLPEPASYDSVGINFLFHCLPGSWSVKGAAFRNAAAAIRAGGRVFGSTVLSSGVPVSAGARRLMRIYNERGIFHNTTDDLDGLRSQLSLHFPAYRISIHGCVAIFEAGEGV